MSAAYCLAAPGDPLHGPYHDQEYGFPAEEDAVLFERLVLEINQAGLSWLTVLKKREAFRRAFAGFEIDRVAGFGEADMARLLSDLGHCAQSPEDRGGHCQCASHPRAARLARLVP
jgi:DNA-3-methyladenine glycosylase I